MAAQSNPTKTAKRELVFTRVFEAPRELVWKAWIDPKQVAAWWGPNGFTNPRCEWDARPGNAIRVDMRGPDGTVYPMGGKFLEVVKPERLVFISLLPGEDGRPIFEVHNTVTLAERDGKTTLTLWVRVISKTSAADRHLEGMEEGWSQSLDRLTANVAAGAAGAADQEIVITRVFDAPRDLVWEAWTERERLMEWFGPKGFTMRTATLDLRPGGVFHYCLRSPYGKDMWATFVYREIVAPERIVLVNSFSDEQGNLTRHPMSPTWPLEMLSTTTFAERDGKTTITVQWAPLNATETERKTFDTSHEGMRMGWTGTFEQLAQYLAKA